MPKSEEKILSFIRTNDVCVRNKVRAWYPKEEVLIIKKGKKKISLEPLYPNYMLFRLPVENVDIYKLIERTQHVLYFLKHQKNKSSKQKLITPVPKKEILDIKRLCGLIRKVEYDHLIGKTVFVCKGSFKGEIGKCKCLVMGKNRAVVQMEVLGIKKAKREVEINLDFLELYE